MSNFLPCLLDQQKNRLSSVSPYRKNQLKGILVFLAMISRQTCTK